MLALSRQPYADPLGPRRRLAYLYAGHPASPWLCCALRRLTFLRRALLMWLGNDCARSAPGCHHSRRCTGRRVLYPFLLSTREGGAHCVLSETSRRRIGLGNVPGNGPPARALFPAPISLPGLRPGGNRHGRGARAAQAAFRSGDRGVVWAPFAFYMFLEASLVRMSTCI
jgi:hypothetical protein